MEPPSEGVYGEEGGQPGEAAKVQHHLPMLSTDPSGPESASDRSAGNTSLDCEAEEEDSSAINSLDWAARRSLPALSRVEGSERVWHVLEFMLSQGEKQRWFNEWRVGASRHKATTLALWAVDQGNRKAYEVERALMAENNWATSSIIWEGYSQSPLTGLTGSGSFWAAGEASEEGAAGAARTREALKVSQQQKELLKVQVEAARQQLAEWQDVADFQMVEDGSWKSMRVQALKRQIQVMRREQKAARAAGASPFPSAQLAEGEALEGATPRSPGEEGGAPAESQKEAVRSLSSDMRNWMMGYESKREIQSTISGLSTQHPPGSPDASFDEDLSLDPAALQRQMEEDEEEFGPCIDDLTLLEATMQAHDLGASSGVGGGETARTRLSQMLLDHASEHTVCRRGMHEGRFSAEFALAAQERHYAELRTLSTSLEERLGKAIAKVEQAEREKCKAMEMMEEARAAAAKAIAGEAAASPGGGGGREEALLRKLESVNAQLREKSMLIDQAVCGAEYVL